MRIVDIENGNFIMAETVEALGTVIPCKIIKQITDNDEDIRIIAVMPSKEDIEALKAGRPILLTVVGDFPGSVSLITYDNNGNANV